MKKIIQKIDGFPAYLKSRIIGQDHVIDAYVEKISYAERGISNPKRPKACFFFLGPTGTGKTEIVRETMQYFHGDIDSHLLRLDMSEFGETAGSDVGKRLVGYTQDEPGRLYEYLEKTEKTGGAILYDEFEKAHRDIAKYMLQQLDAARVTLFNNKVYNLNRHYLFFTSNVAADIFQGNNHISMARKVEAAVNTLKRQFNSPEFIARFGAFNYGIIAFKSLTPAHLRTIAQKFINDEIRRFRNIKDTSHTHPDNLIIEGYSEKFVEHILLQTNTTLNGAREIRDITERMLNKAYVHAFNADTIGKDIRGYLHLANRQPIVIEDEPPKCIKIE